MMPRQSPRRSSRLLLAVWLLPALCLAPLAGCALDSLPRIDPSGEQILIFPGETPPAAPGQPIPVGPAVPADPFITGTQITPPPGNLPAPPVYAQSTRRACPCCPCCPIDQLINGPPAVVGPVGPTPQERVTITPQRVLAPVGSEVIVRSGICGASGYLMTNERIEWMLGRQGVGQFVTIGERGESDVLRWPWERPNKVDNLYAVGYTSPFSTCLRRNAADPVDDVQIQSGEAWISVTSAAEGTSYVTAYAPTVKDWQTRKASAVIYWVDAQWSLPPSTAVQAGQPHVLTTTVTRQSDGAPIAGWIVRYEVADASGARLGYDAGQVAEATTDSSGRASVEVKPTDANPGVSNVRVTIIRPAQSGPAASPQLDIGTGQATIQWATDIPATGLPTIEPQPQLPSDFSTPPISPPVTPPVSPPVAPPLETPPRVIEQPPFNSAPSGRPDLTVQLRRETPDPIRVGDTVGYTILVRNNGTAPARNILITYKYDQGLSNEFDEGTGKLEHTSMKDLGPGESDLVPLQVQVLEAGPRRSEVTVTADGATEAYERDSFEAQPITPPLPNLNVTLQADRQKTVGELTTFRAVIENTGTTAATNLVVQMRPAPGLLAKQYDQAIQGSETVQPFGSGYQWTRERLEPGQKRELRLVCECQQANPRAAVVLGVTADGGFNRALEEGVEVLAPIGGPGPGGGGTVTPPAAQGLQLKIDSPANPARVGARSVLTVYVSNFAAAPQRQVLVQVAIPQGLRAVTEDLQGSYQELAGGVLQFATIAEIAPGKRQAILIPIEHLNQGRVKIQARVQSAETPEWVESDYTLDINPQ